MEKESEHSQMDAWLKEQDYILQGMCILGAWIFTLIFSVPRPMTPSAGVFFAVNAIAILSGLGYLQYHAVKVSREAQAYCDDKTAKLKQQLVKLNYDLMEEDFHDAIVFADRFDWQHAIESYTKGIEAKATIEQKYGVTCDCLGEALDKTRGHLSKKAIEATDFKRNGWKLTDKGFEKG